MIATAIPPQTPKTPAERAASGKVVRADVTRSSHGRWKEEKDRKDPIALLEESSRSRLPHLVPIRYGRMLASPFTYLRGSPIVMANDLASSPLTGFTVQACGDAHLRNFGLYASPERNLLFDVNDFDETLPGPHDHVDQRGANSRQGQFLQVRSDVARRKALLNDPPRQPTARPPK